MRILSLLVFSLLFVFFVQQPKSPHGTDFKISCGICHSPESWQIDKSVYSFNHNKTKFVLKGQHSDVNCRQCHASLVFSEARTECNECHSDVHQGSAGLDCERCHNPDSWLVNNVAEIHRMSRFPLLGAHRTADCSDCHKSETFVRFDVQGIECIDCHRDDYLATTNPNHVQAGVSEDCSLCHQVNAFQWSGGGFNHDFFPLVQGHAPVNCAECHTSGNYTAINNECESCHLNVFQATTNPNHVASGFPTACGNCHTLNPGWKPAAFDHSSFPLTLGHSIASCIDCHPGGNYTSTPTDCYSCHQQDFTGTTNPNHVSSQFSTDCLLCHSVNPGWKPATFDHSIFPLTLGHSTPACSDCHIDGNYTTTPTECYLCHTVDYNNANNPNHKSLAFATVCTQCHTTNPGWTPATYTQHDSQFFPIYSGNHRGQWSACSECHTNASDYSQFNCLNCHEDAHRDENYTNAQCLECHPRGTED